MEAQVSVSSGSPKSMLGKITAAIKISTTAGTITTNIKAIEVRNDPGRSGTSTEYTIPTSAQKPLNSQTFLIGFPPWKAKSERKNLGHNRGDGDFENIKLFIYK